MPEAYASTEKRAELVRAAAGLLHRQGLQCTTLADVANAAAVPLGNVYYYFKTKEALAEAVIAAHEAALHERFASWDAEYDDPKERLRRLVLAPLDSAETIVKFGCPHGSLCQELEKLGADTPLAKASSRLLGAYVKWATNQFRALSAGRDAAARALELVAAVQGTMLLAHSMQSMEVLTRQLRRFERTLDTLPSKRSARRKS